MFTRRTILASACAALLPRPHARASRQQPNQQQLCLQGGKVDLGCGQRVAYEQSTPDGALVFYFHGTPGSRREGALIHREAQKARVRLVGLDRPGMGDSTYQPQRRILDWPAQVEQVAAALGFAAAPFGIVALSGGAPYALACARQIPHRLTHVAIVSGHTPPDAQCVTPGSEDRKIELVGRHPRLATRVLRVLDRRLERAPEKTVQRVAQSWTEADRRLVLCNPWLKQQLLVNLHLATQCGPQGVITDITLLGSCWGFRVSEAQGVRVSLWYGACDKIAPPSMGRYFQRQMPHSELSIDAQGGHVTTLKDHAAEIFARMG